jgi:pimeloyl-ACP methyl ester carboxylesterase
MHCEIKSRVAACWNTDWQATSLRHREQSVRRCRPRRPHARVLLWALPLAALVDTVLIAQPAASIPMRRGYGEGKITTEPLAGRETLPGWGEATGGVPTDEELRTNFPPIPINISVSPVVLVPGIGGSVLVAPSGLQVWIRLYEATYYFQRYMWGRYNESTHTIDPITADAHVIGPWMTSGFGLDAIANLDPEVHWPIYNYVSYFDVIIKTLESQGWLRGKTLFGVPYDWRQSVCHGPTLAALEAQILRAMRDSDGRKVSLVSHSMGALVIRCLMQTNPLLFDTAVERWVAIAAPHQGAGAKILLEFLQVWGKGGRGGGWRTWRGRDWRTLVSLVVDLAPST